MHSIKFQKFSHGVAFFVIMLAASLMVSRLPVAADSTQSDAQHLLTVHDRGTESSFITKRQTLREVFKEADIRLDENDIVEPGLDEELQAKDYQVNIYRARPVTIIDGSTKVQVMSAYQTPQQVAKAAGIALNDEDIATLSINQEMVSSGASVQMTIKRATPVTLVLYGQKKQVYTQAETVGDLLDEKSVRLQTEDTVSLSRDTAIIPGMRIDIWRNGKQTVTVDEKIPYGVDRIEDSSQSMGYTKVRSEGVNGKRSVTYEIVMKNGREVSRKKIQNVILKKAVKQVLVVGTKTKNAGGSCGQWMSAAGIKDMANATYLINAESGCNPNAVNPSSGACGVGQALPCGKTGCDMGDGFCQTKWMNGYVMGRYGSWQAAADHHRTRGWY